MNTNLLFLLCCECDRTLRMASTSTNPSHSFICPICDNIVCQALDNSRHSSLSYRAGISTTSSSAAQLLDTMAQIINFSPRRPALRSQFTINISYPRPLPRLVSPQENIPSRGTSQGTHGQTQMPQDPISENNTCSYMTVVRVTADTLSCGSACPICKEDFVLNQEIKPLACNHFYHSDCIRSWLQINNTCPVCRYQLPIQQGLNDGNSVRNNSLAANDGHNAYDSDDEYDLRLEDVVNLSWPSWTEMLSLLGPFRLGPLLDWF